MYEKIPPVTHLRQICCRGSAANINAKFGRAGEMDFKVEGRWYTEKYLNPRHPRIGQSTLLKQ